MTISLPQSGAASDASLALLAEQYGDLPSDYFRFLAVHDGVKPPANVLEGSNYGVGVSDFVPASEIIGRARTIEGMSSNFFPIAEDSSGNFVCLGANDHKIYFWDHEVETDKVIAESFTEFLNRLEPFDLSSIQLKPSQVKRVWVNPGFKPEF